MIFVDTGAWFASVVPSDADHASASQWLKQNSQPLLTTDYIIEIYSAPSGLSLTSTAQNVPDFDSASPGVFPDKRFIENRDILGCTSHLILAG